MAKQQRPFVVFDIDGTLIRWQLYHAVVERLAKNDLLGPDAHTTLHKARMVWKRREHPEAFKAYEKQLIRVYEQALPSIDSATFDTLAEEVATKYKTQVYTYTRDLAKKLKQQGYVLLAISGSHQELVEHIAKQYNFDDCIGTRYEREGNVFSGKRFIASYDKHVLLEKLIKKHNLSLAGSIAIGDSKSDAVMLAMVEQPIAFNPDRELFTIAKASGWKIVIERKNVVYTLEQKQGNYTLIAP